MCVYDLCPAELWLNHSRSFQTIFNLSSTTIPCVYTVCSGVVPTIPGNPDPFCLYNGVQNLQSCLSDITVSLCVHIHVHVWSWRVFNSSNTVSTYTTMFFTISYVTHTLTHTHTHTYIHTHTHTHAHSHIYTPTHAHTHTHSPIPLTFATPSVPLI